MSTALSAYVLLINFLCFLLFCKDHLLLSQFPKRSGVDLPVVSLTGPFQPKKQGDAESQILTFAETSHGKVEASVARPGLILGPEDQERRVTSTFPSMEVDELAAALLDQVTKGFEKTMLLHDDLVRLGQHAVTRNR